MNHSELLQAAPALTAVDKLAIRTAIASLDFLKQAAIDLGVGVEFLTPELLAGWIADR